MLAQALGSLPPPETWMEFWLPGFSLAQPWLLQQLGKWTIAWKISFSGSLPLN